MVGLFARALERRVGRLLRQHISFPLPMYFELRYIVSRNMARKTASGPATDPELLILSSLAGGPKHGYAVMQDVSTFAGVQLGPGTLYTAITRLVDEHWVEPMETSGRQRPYRITSAGLGYLRVQLEKMRRLSSFGLRRIRAV